MFEYGGITYLWEDCTVGFLCPTCEAELVADSQDGECICECGFKYHLSSNLFGGGFDTKIPIHLCQKPNYREGIMPLNYKLSHKEYLAESPGIFKDSKLTFKITGDKYEVQRIADAIQKAIAEKGEV